MTAKTFHMKENNRSKEIGDQSVDTHYKNPYKNLWQFFVNNRMANTKKVDHAIIFSRNDKNYTKNKEGTTCLVSGP